MKLKTAQDLEKQVVLGMDTSIRSKLNAVLKMIQSCKNHICLWVFISSYERDLQLIFVQRECVLRGILLMMTRTQLLLKPVSVLVLKST